VRAWLDGQLAPGARARVDAAARRAIVDLSRELALPPHADLVDALGVPTPAQAEMLLVELFELHDRAA
jgi:hypothetical protein